MTTSPDPLVSRRPIVSDPVPATLDSLASARWMREPNWRTFQEKLVNTRSVRRFEFLRSRTVLLTSIAALALGGVATAAAVKAYQVYHFTATMTNEDGTTTQVQGQMTVDAAVPADGGDAPVVNVEIPGDLQLPQAGDTATFVITGAAPAVAPAQTGWDLPPTRPA